MKFLYKIYSAYDGFTPRRIPERIQAPNLLTLGWDRYVDVLEKGFEVWVYFHGPHAFQPGVYVKGFTHSISGPSVLLRVREYSTKDPLTDRETSQRVAEVVRPRYRQVFLLPEDWVTPPACSIGSTADSCKQRLCDKCPAWISLPLMQPATFHRPERLPSAIKDFVPAYWAIPSRCYLGREIGRRVRNTSEIFYRFKVGEAALAYPLALGIFEALRCRDLLDFDAIVPIPLSPDKTARGELNRTLLLAQELAKLLAVPVLDVLNLTSSFSKKSALAAGATPRQYEEQYYEKIAIETNHKIPNRILLVDDVCTRGSTLTSAWRRLLEANPACQVIAATAAQMILKNVVRDEEALTAN